MWSRFSQSISSFPLPVVAAYPAGFRLCRNLFPIHLSATLTELFAGPEAVVDRTSKTALHTATTSGTHPGIEGNGSITAFGGKNPTITLKPNWLAFKLLP